jgi:hypothetical protein
MKLYSTELNHRICDMALELMGPYAALWQDSKHVVDDGHWHYEHMFTLGLIIGGGTSQIQKNISQSGPWNCRNKRRENERLGV